MPTALVTGAAGFIGSHLVGRLIQRGYRIVAVDNLLWGEERLTFLEGSQIRLQRCDIRDESSMKGVLAFGPFDIVYHLAALHYIPYCSAHPVETLDVNVTGTQVLLEALKNKPALRFIFASTGDVYSPQPTPHQETDPLGPTSIYGTSKEFGERLIASASREMAETDWVVARLFNAYGPRETNPHVIPSILKQLKLGTRVRLGNTWPRRDYVHVRDIAEALLALGTRTAIEGHQVFNVGTGDASSVEDIITTLRRILRKDVSVEVDSERVRPVERPHLQANSDKLQSVTEWRPDYRLEDGLRNLCFEEGLLEREGLS